MEALGSKDLTQFANSSLLIGWPGWPCEYANVDIVQTPEFFRATFKDSGSLTCSILMSNWASESTREAMAAKCGRYGEVDKPKQQG